MVWSVGRRKGRLDKNLFSPHHNSGSRPRSRSGNPPTRRCRANMRPLSIRSRTARPDFKGPTIQAGFTILRGKTRRPVPYRSRCNIPIPPAPRQGAGAIRRCGDSTHGWQDATGFHKFVWIVGYAPRIGIKRGRGVSPYSLVLGTLNLEAVLRPCRVPPKYKRDITRTDNIYTQI